MFPKREKVKAQPETVELERFCGYCGERLPHLAEGEFGFCPECRRRYGKREERRVKPEQVRFSYGPGYCNFKYRAPGPVFRDPVLAAVLSIIIPGGGQVYNHHFLKGILIFATSFLVVPYILGVLDAYICARSINRRQTAAAARRRDYSGPDDFRGGEYCAEPSY